MPGQRYVVVANEGVVWQRYVFYVEYLFKMNLIFTLTLRNKTLQIKIPLTVTNQMDVKLISAFDS